MIAHRPYDSYYCLVACIVLLTLGCACMCAESHYVYRARTIYNLNTPKSILKGIREVMVHQDTGDIYFVSTFYASETLITNSYNYLSIIYKLSDGMVTPVSEPLHKSCVALNQTSGKIIAGLQVDNTLNHYLKEINSTGDGKNSMLVKSAPPYTMQFVNTTLFLYYGSSIFKYDHSVNTLTSNNIYNLYINKMCSGTKDGFLYFTTSSYQLKRISPNNEITIVAGISGVSKQGGDGGPAEYATFGSAEECTVSSAGDIYIRDGMNVRKIFNNNTITTVLVSKYSIKSMDSYKEWLLFSTIENTIMRLYPNGTLEKVLDLTKDQSSIMSEIDASNFQSSAPYLDFKGFQLLLLYQNTLLGIYFSNSGDSSWYTAMMKLYLSDTTIQKVKSPYPQVSAMQFALSFGNLFLLNQNGKSITQYNFTTNTQSTINFDSEKSGPMAISEKKDIYIVGNRNSAYSLYKIPYGSQTPILIAGNEQIGYTFRGENGSDASQALFYNIRQLYLANVIQPDGTYVEELYIADYNRIRMIRNNSIYTIAGTSQTVSEYSPDGSIAVNSPLIGYIHYGLFVTSRGVVYFIESAKVRKVENGILTTVAGNGNSEGFISENTIATASSFMEPHSLVVNETDNTIIVANSGSLIKLSPECEIGYYGTNCSQFNCFGKSDNTKCNYGVCQSPDYCQCYSNYFGSNCNITKCFNILSNETNTCSGNGECISPNQCQCKAGWTGASCSIPICFGKLANDSTVCSSSKQGICISPDQCQCKLGYNGLQCEDYSCFGISKNSSNVCSSRGKCSELNICQCNSNYYGSNCEITKCFGELSNSSSVCSSHGKCIDFNECSCNQNYFDVKCEITQCFNKLSNETTVCNSNGTCSDFNQCKCKSNYFGSNCNITKCFNILSNETNTCSGNGECISPNQCQCKTGYSGPNCEFSVCYGIASNIETVCSSSKQGICISPDQCQCKSGYSGLQCEDYSCFGVSKNSSNVCSSRGKCSELNTCQCNSNYYGSNCEITKCFGELSNSSSVCSSHGSCVSANNCSCFSNYLGERCNLFKCYSYLSNETQTCSGNGKCINFNTCNCTKGYSGNECQFTTCFGINSNSKDVCSSRGSCKKIDSCECNTNYFGNDCSLTTCFGVVNNDRNVCSSKGNCSNFNNCTCIEGWGGDCSIPTCNGVLATNPNVCNGVGKCSSPNTCTVTSSHFQYRIEQVTNLNSDLTRFGEINAIVFDELTGVLFFSDRSRIYKWNELNNSISLFAGVEAYVYPSTSYGFNGDDIPALETSFGVITDIALSAGDLFILDSSRIRKVSKYGGNTKVIVGNKSSKGGYDLSNTKKATDFVLLANHLDVSRFTNEILTSNFGQLVAAKDDIIYPITSWASYIGCMCSSPIKNETFFFVSPYLKKLDHSTGIITNIAGNYGARQSSGDGGPAIDAIFDAIECSTNGSDIFIVDDYSKSVRKIDSNGIINTIYTSKGDAIKKIFVSNSSIFVSFEKRVDRILSNGTILTIIDNTKIVKPLEVPVVWNGNNLTITASRQLNSQFYYFSNGHSMYCYVPPIISPMGIASCNSFNQLSFLKLGDATSYKITKCGLLDWFDFCIKTDNGNIYKSHKDQILQYFDENNEVVLANITSSDFQPVSITHPNGSISNYIFVKNNAKLTRIDLDTGIVEKIIGIDYFENSMLYNNEASLDFYRDGDLAINALLSSSFNFHVTKKGEIFIADTRANTIRVISLDGRVRRIAGTGEQGFYNQGLLATQSQVFSPVSISVDELTNIVYITEAGRVRKLIPNGCENGYFGQDCSEYMCFSKSNSDLNVCSNHGTCASFDYCQCNSNYLGSNCEITKCFGELSNSSSVCSTHGKCTNFNECSCNQNYFGVKCEITQCFNKLSNESNSCSGNGECILTDFCKCKTGYSGPKCEFSVCYGIASNIGSVCSGHGQCIGVNNCSCYEGYSGNNCENIVNIPISCFGFLQSDSRTCSSHGSCISTDHCECQNGWNGNLCDIPTCNGISSQNSKVCSGHGYCDAPNSCKCSNGYSGPNCEFSVCYGIASNIETVCSGHGQCIGVNNCSCYEGYYGSNCQNIVNIPISCFGISQTDSHVCSSRGVCESSNVCKCSQGYEGNECESFKCFSILNNDTNVCNGKGNCIDVNTCQCFNEWSGNECKEYSCYGVSYKNSSVCSGHGYCDAPNSCNCSSEYTGLDCNVLKNPSVSCFGFLQSDSRTCSSRGSCISTDHCECQNGWNGNLCDFPTCNGISSQNSKVCSEHGSCDAPNSCKCSNGYSGPNCEYYNCYGIASNIETVCSGHGQCIGVNNCSCNEYYKGSSCNFHTCFGIAYYLSNACSGNGTCINVNQCQCKPNYYGNDCSFTNSTITNNSTIIDPIIIENNSTTTSNNTFKFTITSNNENLQYINPNEDLILKSIIIEEYLPNTVYSYKWTSPMSGIDTTRSYLIIPKSLLLIGYSFSVTLTISSPKMESVSKTIKLKVNEPPKLGSFYISPNSGFVLETQFKLEAIDWYDENEPLTYRFVYRYENELTWKTLSEQSNRQLLYTELPLGIIQLSVFIYDSFNSFTQSEIISVQVSQKSQISTETLTKLESQTSLSAPLLSTLSNIISNNENNSTSSEVKEKVVQIISNYFTKQLDQLGDLNITSNQLSSSVSTISSVSSSISHLDSNTKSVVLDYFAGTLEKATSNNIQLSNDDFQVCLSSITMMEEQTSKRTTQKYTKVIKIYKLLSDIKSRSLLEDGSPNKIYGKVFKSYSKYVKSYSALQDVFYDQTRINMRPLQVPSCIVNVKTYTNEILSSDFKFSKIIEFTLQNANTMQNIDLVSSNVLSQLTFPFNSSNTGLRRSMISTNCKFQISNGDFVDDFCQLNNNDGILTMNISRTGAFIIGYQEVTQSIDPVIPTPVTPTPQPESSSSFSPMIIGLSIGLPVVAFIVIVIILLVLVFYLLRRNRDMKSKLEKTSDNIVDGQYLENLQNVKSKQDFEMKEIENIKLDEPACIDVDFIDFEPLEQGPLLIPQEELTLISKLGSGGFGTVYKSEYKPKRGKESKLVAVKSINDDDSLMGSSAGNSTSSQTISSEALLMCSLDHPNIVKCFGISIKESIQLIVMEYVEGGSLQELINELKSGKYFMDVNEKIDILIQISKGINYLHNLTKPIVHRDLKPANCLIDRSKMNCKLCDFGLSKAYSGNTMNSMTNNIGTLYYMANVSISNMNFIVTLKKELISGTARKEHAKAIDIYSFAILMWELLFEDNPYTYKNVDKLFFETSIEDSGYEGLNGFNVLPRVMNGLRPVIPYNQDNCLRWIDKFLHTRYTTKSVAKCLVSLKSLLEDCWNATPQQRPSFDIIINRLESAKKILEVNMSAFVV